MAILIKTPTEGIIQSVMEVYERGRVVEALRMAETFAPLREPGKRASAGEGGIYEDIFAHAQRPCHALFGPLA